MKNHTLTLTVAETRHLLVLLQDSARSGEYYGNRDEYWKRHQRIVEKLTGGEFPKELTPRIPCPQCFQRTEMCVCSLCLECAEPNDLCTCFVCDTCSEF